MAKRKAIMVDLKTHSKVLGLAKDLGFTLVDWVRYCVKIQSKKNGK